MRRLVATTAAVAVLGLGLGTTVPPPAQAQIAVIDPQAIVQAIRQVEQQLQMIAQLQQQVAGQAAMLQRLGVDVTGPLQQIASEATQLLQTAQGIGYQGQNLAQQFERVYPTNLNAMSFAQTRQALAGWQANSRQTLQEAMATQNLIVRSQPTTAGAVNAAVAASQNAPGQTAAIQATNQLLASLSTQLTQLQTILITQGRAAQTAEAQAQGARAAAAAESRRYWNIQRPASRVQNPGVL